MRDDQVNDPEAHAFVVATCDRLAPLRVNLWPPITGNVLGTHGAFKLRQCDRDLHNALAVLTHTRKGRERPVRCMTNRIEVSVIWTALMEGADLTTIQRVLTFALNEGVITENATTKSWH